jgi:hypothetical protein
MRGLHHFKIYGKLVPRYIGPFKILEQRGKVAYQLELPPQLSDVHDVFRSTEKMFMSSGRTNAPRRVTSWRRSYLSRIPGENLGYFRESHSK